MYICTNLKELLWKKVILAVSALILSACNLGSTIANTTEEVANKTATKAGEILGGSTRSFADGVGEGLDKAGNSSIKLSENLSKKGIKLGGHKIETLSGNDKQNLNIFHLWRRFYRHHNCKSIWQTKCKK